MNILTESWDNFTDKHDRTRAGLCIMVVTVAAGAVRVVGGGESRSALARRVRVGEAAGARIRPNFGIDSAREEGKKAHGAVLRS
jgi:hypothetical protein